MSGGTGPGTIRTLSDRWALRMGTRTDDKSGYTTVKLYIADASHSPDGEAQSAPFLTSVYIVRDSERHLEIQTDFSNYRSKTYVRINKIDEFIKKNSGTLGVKNLKELIHEMLDEQKNHEI